MHGQALGQQEPHRDALAGGGVVVTSRISNQEEPIPGDPAGALVEEPGGERAVQGVGPFEQRQRLPRRPRVVVGDRSDGVAATQHGHEQLLRADWRLVPLVASGEGDRDAVHGTGVDPPVTGETVPPVTRGR